MPGVDEGKDIWEGSGLTHDVIAAQCCTVGGTCSREVNGECVAGHSKSLNGAIMPFTYAKNEEFCTANGLEMCKQSCAGKGCWYNYHPVFTSLPCPAPEPCTNTCQYYDDTECDDGGPGAEWSECPLGSDCDDCGDRKSVV